MNHFLTSAKSVKHEKNASISNKLFILKIFTFISADELSYSYASSNGMKCEQRKRILAYAFIGGN